MAKRVQSPSSINLYKQCPRRYYYQYVKKIPTRLNIHLVRGNIVHDALEKFFDVDIKNIDPLSYKKEMAFYLKNLFEACWKQNWAKLHKLGLSPDQLTFYCSESMDMLANWLNDFLEKLSKKMEASDLITAFNSLKPFSREEKYRDGELMVMGYVDAIHKGKETVIVDYKTSKCSNMTDAYRLQLAIYALLYHRKHQELPDKVGIWFLKSQPKFLKVDEGLIKDALFEVEQIHAATETELIVDYPKKKSGLCKYSTGQCDFYDFCCKE